MRENLKAKKRTETGKKVKGLRNQGLTPGIVYGKKLANIMVSVNLADFREIFKKAGENALINLEIEGEIAHTVLIQDVVVDPVKGTPLHVDFYQVRLDEKIKTEPPLVFEGISKAVKELAGTLIKQLHSVEVESLPTNIPPEIKVDVSQLETFDDLIKVKDLLVGEGVEILTDKEEVVALVAPPRSEEELAKLEEEVTEDVTQVEGVVDKTTAPEGGGSSTESEAR